MKNLVSQHHNTEDIVEATILRAKHCSERVRMNLINFVKVTAFLTLIGSGIAVVVMGLMESTPWLQFSIAAGIAAISFCIIDNIDGIAITMLRNTEYDD